MLWAILKAIRIACLLIYGAFESVRYKVGRMWSNDLKCLYNIPPLSSKRSGGVKNLHGYTGTEDVGGNLG